MAISFSTLRKTAHTLGSLTTTTIRSGLLSPQDNSDGYTFKLTRRSNVSLNLSQLKANTKLNLLSSTGALLVSKTNGNNGQETLTKTLNPGTYYIQATTIRGKTRYRLQASAQPTIESPLTALNLGTPLTTVVERGSLDGTHSDYYRFTLDRASQFNLSASSAGFRLFQSANNGTSPNAIGTEYVFPMLFDSFSSSFSDWLPKGTYFIQMSNLGANGATPYTLSLQVNPTNNPNYLDLAPGSNASATSAYSIGILNGRQTIEQYVGQFSPVNYYQFQLNGTRDFNATISNYSPIVGGPYTLVEMQLYYDANNNGLIDTNEQIGYDYTSDDDSSLTISQAAQKPGTYFLKIQPEFPSIPWAYPGRYDLTLSATPSVPSS